MKPLCIDLFCGLGGWTEGFLSEGYDVVGFDNERHVYGSQRYPAQLVLQDVLTLHGSQFRDAACIVASPPCQNYSYMAQPWRRAKREFCWQQWERTSPFGNFRLNDLFNACLQIQRQASQAAGHHIPLVVENVKGAQPWVGSAAWHYGSFYLWGDLPAIMPSTAHWKLPAHDTFRANGVPVGRMTEPRYPSKNSGGSWFAQAHNTKSGHSRNPVTGEGVKQHGSGPAWFDKALDERRRNATAGTKATADGGSGYGGDFGWDRTALRRGNSHSSARKAASAQIAKIPFELASYIARVYHPGSELKAVG